MFKAFIGLLCFFAAFFCAIMQVIVIGQGEDWLAACMRLADFGGYGTWFVFVGYYLPAIMALLLMLAARALTEVPLPPERLTPSARR